MLKRSLVRDDIMTLMGFQSYSSSDFTNTLADLNNTKSLYRWLASSPGKCLSGYFLKIFKSKGFLESSQSLGITIHSFPQWCF